MTIKLYMNAASPAVRSVQITARALNIELELIEINPAKEEQKTPEYLKMNPQHTVPVLDDNGFVFWDSHAIMPYLVDKYGKNDSLFPKDLQKRAIVNQRLHFESGVLFARALLVVRSIFLKQAVTQDQQDMLIESYEFLEKFLDGNKWMAGDSITIADYSIFSTLSTCNYLIPIDPKTYPKLTVWLKNVAALPECEINKEGLEVWKERMNASRSA